jgi:hypothetical protein
MKSIWAFVMTAATVTVYVHVRHNEPIVTHVRHVQGFEAAASPEATPVRDIVVAPFSGGTVGDRWGGSQTIATPAPLRAGDH